MNVERRRIADKYLKGINHSEVILPFVPEYAEPVWHIFAVRCKRRNDLEKYLNDKGISTNKHYPIPIHKQECYCEFAGIDLPIATEISETELSLPMYYGMKDNEIEYIIDTINEFI